MPNTLPKEVEIDRPLQRLITLRLLRLSSKLNAQAARILKESAGISINQWRMFVMVKAHGEITPAEIVRQTGFDKGLISRTLKRMVEDGLLTSTISESDGRSHVMRMTEKGFDLYERARPWMHRRRDRLESALTASELAMLYDAFDKLEGAIEDLEAQR